MKKRVVIGLLVLLLVGLIQIPAYAGTSTKYSTQTKGNIPLDATLFDLLILRPMGIASCAVGIVTGIWAIPFTATSGSAPETYDKLINEPFSWTFQRPVGYDY